jgi:hypothetical protein
MLSITRVFSRASDLAVHTVKNYSKPARGCRAGDADALEASAAELSERVGSAERACRETRASEEQASKRRAAAVSAHEKAVRYATAMPLSPLLVHLPDQKCSAAAGVLALIGRRTTVRT